MDSLIVTWLVEICTLHPGHLQWISTQCKLPEMEPRPMKWPSQPQTACQAGLGGNPVRIIVHLQVCPDREQREAPWSRGDLEGSVEWHLPLMPMLDSPSAKNAASDGVLTPSIPCPCSFLLSCTFPRTRQHKLGKKGRGKSDFFLLFFSQEKGLLSKPLLPVTIYPVVMLVIYSARGEFIAAANAPSFLGSCEATVIKWASTINKTDKCLPFPNCMWADRKQRAGQLADNPKTRFGVRSHCRGLQSHL